MERISADIPALAARLQDEYILSGEKTLSVSVMTFARFVFAYSSTFSVVFEYLGKLIPSTTSSVLMVIRRSNISFIPLSERFTISSPSIHSCLSRISAMG